MFGRVPNGFIRQMGMKKEQDVCSVVTAVTLALRWETER